MLFIPVKRGLALRDFIFSRRPGFPDEDFPATCTNDATPSPRLRAPLLIRRGGFLPGAAALVAHGSISPQHHNRAGQPPKPDKGGGGDPPTPPPLFFSEGVTPPSMCRARRGYPLPLSARFSRTAMIAKNTEKPGSPPEAPREAMAEAVQEKSRSRTRGGGG